MERAILMASGMGTRMRPITNTVPKPLVEVAGRPMIESVIDGLLHRGVGEIVVVVGYLAPQFDYLLEKYPQVRIIENKVYETVNNISSVKAASEVLRSGDPCFICEADICAVSPEIFDGVFEDSCYYGRMVEGHSDDWVFDVGSDGYITRVGKVGEDQYNMTGISYLLPHDATELADFIDEAYEQGDYEELFWDDIVNDHLDTLKMVVHPISEELIREIDTVEELEQARAELIWQ